MKNQCLKRDSAECALKFLEKYAAKDAQVQAYKVFKVLAELTIDDLNAGKTEKECQYTANQIGEKWRVTKDEILIKRKLDDLIEKRIPRHTNTFNEIAIEHKLLAIPKVEKIGTDGGKGITNVYYIGYQVLDSALNTEFKKSIAQDEVSENYIEYDIDNIKLPHFNWIYNYNIEGFRFYLEIFNLLIYTPTILILFC